MRDILDLGHEEIIYDMDLVPDHLQETEWLSAAADNTPYNPMSKGGDVLYNYYLVKLAHIYKRFLKKTVAV